jgi:hypothetical protein
MSVDITKKPVLKSINFWCVVFFAVYLIVGLFIYRDYGISWDENTKRVYVGEATYNYIFHNDSLLFVHATKYYGPVFDFALIAIEKNFSMTDTRDIFLMRHLLTFLLFYGSVVVFFFFCKKLFDSSHWALVACAMLVISPHIFAHSFYNSTDIPFLSFFIIAVATMYYFIKKQSWWAVLLHSFTTALAIDIRILGILVPVFTVAMIVAIFFVEKNISIKKALSILMVYALLTILFVIAFWPYLWGNPIHNFLEAFIMMSRFVLYGSDVLYMGNNLHPNELPWHYIPVWMAITLPVSYIVLFFVGVWSLLYNGVRQSFKTFYSQYYFFVFVFFLMIAPLSAVIIFNSTLYDGWRHLFFIYPLFVLIATLGLRYLYSVFTKAILKFILIAAFAVNVAFVLFFMISKHPFQNVYFNFIPGDMKTAKNNYEMDYWGLSYKQALEYIVKADTSSKIRVAFANEPGVYNGMILPKEDQLRITFVDRPDTFDYFMTNYRWHKGAYDYPNECFAIEVGNAKIMSVFKTSKSKK